LKWLREIAVFLFAISLGLLPNVLAQGQKASPPSKTRSKAAPPHIREVSLDEVLGWRKQYVDLLGEDRGWACHAAQCVCTPFQNRG
jgi:hypothetical protein